MLARILAVAKKEFLQLKRDKRTAGMAIAIPLVWLLVFGYAADFNVHSISTVIVNESKSTQAKDLVEKFWKEGSFEKSDLKVTSRRGIIDALRDSKAKAGVYIPADYGTNKSASVTVYTDGSDLFASQSTVGKGMKIFQEAAGDQAIKARNKALKAIASTPFGVIAARNMATVSIPAPPKVTHLFNPSLKSSYIMIPGLVGMVLAFILTLMTALGVVRERERGTMEQLLVTPIKPIELMLGKILPYVVIGLLDFALVMFAGTGVFGVPFSGAVLPFGLATLAFLICSLGMGLVVSTVSQNQQQAMQMAMFTLFPQFILSGFVFPLSSMPSPVRFLGYLLPLTHYLPVSRAAFLKGDGVTGLWPSVAILWVYAVLMIGVASMRFRRKLS